MLVKEGLQVDLLEVPLLGGGVPDVEVGGEVVIGHLQSLALQRTHCRHLGLQKLQDSHCSEVLSVGATVEDEVIVRNDSKCD